MAKIPHMSTDNIRSAAVGSSISGTDQRRKIIARKLGSAETAAAIGLTVAAILAVGKISIGLVAGSSAMVSDGINSGFDMVCAALAALGVKLSKKPADNKFNFGYVRFECLATLMLSFLLMTAAVIIIKNAVTSLVSGSYVLSGAPGKAAVIGTLGAILLKLGLYTYFRLVAYSSGSVAVRAEARHHMADALASTGALVGILGARHGLLFMDSAASLLAGFFIAPTAVGIFLDAAPRILDRSCDKETVEQIRAAVGQQSSFVLSAIKTRQSGREIIAELEIRLPGEVSVDEASDIAAHVELCVTSLTNVSRCTVKVNSQQRKSGA